MINNTKKALHITEKAKWGVEVRIKKAVSSNKFDEFEFITDQLFENKSKAISYYITYFKDKGYKLNEIDIR